jgi:large subunit ribosomal protein L21
LPVLADPFWGRVPCLLKRRGGKHSKHRNHWAPGSVRVPVCESSQQNCASLISTTFDGGEGMYAVIRSGGKQYRVSPGDVIRVEKVGTGTNGHVEFPVVAVSAEEGQVSNGADARVVGELVQVGRSPKILVFHFKRKKQYKKLRGHRQSFTAVRIAEIAVGGQSFKAPELPKKEAKPKKVKAAEAEEAPGEEKATAKKKAAPKKAAKKAAKKK